MLPIAGRACACSCLGAAAAVPADLLSFSVNWQQTEHELKASKSHLEMLPIACVTGKVEQVRRKSPWGKAMLPRRDEACLSLTSL